MRISTPIRNRATVTVFSWGAYDTAHDETGAQARDARMRLHQVIWRVNMMRMPENVQSWRAGALARMAAQKLDESRRLRLSVGLAAFAFVVALALYRRFAPYSGGDLQNIYLGAHDLLHGRDMYAAAAAGLRSQGNAFGDVFFYDPLFFLLLSPLTLLPMSAAWTLWAALNGAFVALGCVALVKAVHPRAPWVAGLLLAVLVMLTGMAYFGLYFGNADQLLFFLLPVTYLAARRGHSMAAGILLGLTFAIYMQTLPFALYYLWKREYRTVAIGAAVFVVGVAVCFLVGAPSMFGNFMTILGYFIGSWSAYYINQSVYAVFVRIFEPTPYSLAPVANLPWLAVLLWLGVIAGILSLVARYATRQRIARGEPVRGTLEFALALGGLFLIFPILEANTMISFGLLLVAVLLFVVARWNTGNIWRVGIALLALYLVSCLPLTHFIPLTMYAHHSLSGLGLVVEAFASVPYFYLAAMSCGLVYLALRVHDRQRMTASIMPVNVPAGEPMPVRHGTTDRHGAGGATVDLM